MLRKGAQGTLDAAGWKLVNETTAFADKVQRTAGTIEGLSADARREASFALMAEEQELWTALRDFQARRPRPGWLPRSRTLRQLALYPLMRDGSARMLSAAMLYRLTFTPPVAEAMGPQKGTIRARCRQIVVANSTVITDVAKRAGSDAALHRATFDHQRLETDFDSWFHTVFDRYVGQVLHSARAS